MRHPIRSTQFIAQRAPRTKTTHSKHGPIIHGRKALPYTLSLKFALITLSPRHRLARTCRQLTSPPGSPQPRRVLCLPPSRQACHCENQRSLLAPAASASPPLPHAAQSPSLSKCNLNPQRGVPTLGRNKGTPPPGIAVTLFSTRVYIKTHRIILKNLRSSGLRILFESTTGKNRARCRRSPGIFRFPPVPARRDGARCACSQSPIGHSSVPPAGRGDGPSRQSANPGPSSCHWSKAANAAGLGAEPPANTEVPKNRMTQNLTIFAVSTTETSSPPPDFCVLSDRPQPNPPHALRPLEASFSPPRHRPFSRAIASPMPLHRYRPRRACQHNLSSSTAYAASLRPPLARTRTPRALLMPLARRHNWRALRNTTPQDTHLRSIRPSRLPTHFAHRPRPFPHLSSRIRPFPLASRSLPAATPDICPLPSAATLPASSSARARACLPRHLTDLRALAERLRLGLSVPTPPTRFDFPGPPPVTAPTFQRPHRPNAKPAAAPFHVWRAGGLATHNGPRSRLSPVPAKMRTAAPRWPAPSRRCCHGLTPSSRTAPTAPALLLPPSTVDGVNRRQPTPRILHSPARHERTGCLPTPAAGTPPFCAPYLAAFRGPSEADPARRQIRPVPGLAPRLSWCGRTCTVLLSPTNGTFPSHD